MTMKGPQKRGANLAYSPVDNVVESWAHVKTLFMQRETLGCRCWST